jgi:hypothetical protein
MLLLLLLLLFLTSAGCCIQPMGYVGRQFTSNLWAVMTDASAAAAAAAAQVAARQEGLQSVGCVDRYVHTWAVMTDASAAAAAAAAVSCRLLHPACGR